jgi:hypothetical protein
LKIAKIIVVLCILILFSSCSGYIPSIHQIPEEFQSPQLIAWFDIFSGSIIPVQHTDTKLWGFINKNGEVVLEAIYDNYLPIKDANYISVSKDGLWGLIDRNGKEIVEHIYRDYPVEGEGLVRLYDPDIKSMPSTTLTAKTPLITFMITHTSLQKNYVQPKLVSTGAI